MGKVHREIMNIRDEQLNRALVALAGVGALYLGISLFRAFSFGLRRLFWVQVAVYLAILGIAVFRRRLPFRIRGSILIGAVFVLGVNGYVGWSVATPAVIAFFVSSVISCMAFGYRAGILTMLAGIAAVLALGAAFVSGMIVLPIDIRAYSESWNPWIMTAISLAVAGWLTISAQEAIDRKVAHLAAEIEAGKEEIFRMYEDLKKADEAKEAFISGVSHELRTPLTSIRSFSEILMEYPDEEPAVRHEFLKTIRTESDRLARVINDLLDLSMIRKRTMAFQWAPVDFAEIVREALLQFGPGIREKSLRVDVRIPDDLPRVTGDRGRILQAFSNLLSNAINASSENGELIVSASVLGGRRRRDVSDWLQVTVSDRGPGIGEEDLPHIFEPFYQKAAAGLTDKPRGAGLGLAISKHIVESHGGDIWIESRIGEGTSVHFTLPLERSVRDRDGRDAPGE